MLPIPVIPTATGKPIYLNSTAGLNPTDAIVTLQFPHRENGWATKSDLQSATDGPYLHCHYPRQGD